MDHTGNAHSTNTGNVNCYNVTNSYNNINNINNIANENQEIMQWLSPLNPRRRHQDVRAERVDGVGNWLLGANEFREWRSGQGGVDKAVLFCYGDPGVGKTHLSSLVIDSLCDEPSEEEVAIAIFYCDFRDQEEQTTANIIGAILKQLVVRGEVPDYVQEAFQKAKAEIGGRGLRLPDMVRMLKQAVATLPKVFICIDALDECLPKHLLGLLGSLKDILQESPRTRIFVTGRPQVQAEIRKYFATGVIVPISPKTQDIKKYLENKLEMDPEPVAMSGGLRADILRIIPERISEIFLLVSLVIDTILGEVTIFERRRKLDEMTKGNQLGDAYATTLARLKAQRGGKARLGMEALMWVLNSERPLHTSELCHALGVRTGSADFDPECVPDFRTILGCSLGLITVEVSSSTVRLVHFTLQEYLSSNPSLFLNPHMMIAEVCLTYLNFQCVRALSPALSSAPPTLPFVGYASCCWGKHIREGKAESVSPLALRLLIGFEQHISSQLLLRHYNNSKRWWEPGFDTSRGPIGFSGLHGAAFLGLVEIIAALLAMKEWDINATDPMGQTALAWAAVRGHEDVVKMLLQRDDAKADTMDTEYGRTPFAWAANMGHEGVVKLLLAHEGVNPNTTDISGLTPLSWAARNGHEGVVELLLWWEDINPSTTDRYGRTPLCWATRNGWDGIVRFLLERGDTNPNNTDTIDGRTPLSCAAGYGDEGVVELLLERGDIDPNIADRSGQTPLSWAARNGHEGVIKLLLERENINPNTADRSGVTPLFWAARGLHKGVLNLLLDLEYVNPNIADKSGQTPLLWAARRPDDGLVKLLLEREDTNPNTADTEHSWTPLTWAADNGYEGVVKLLLERSDTNPNTSNRSGRTPLCSAVSNGHEGVIKLLLEGGDTDPNAADGSGLTPIWWAARDGHERVVKLLLERKDVNPNTADIQFGRTPLWWAVVNRNERIVNLLLKREDLNPNIADSGYGRTPLLWAARNGHDRILKLLLERKDINPDIADIQFDRTPLWWAVVNGNEGVVKLLLERGDIDPNTADIGTGRTPLWWAVVGGHKGVINMLLSRGDINPNVPGLYGETAFELDASSRHTRAVEFLSAHKPSLAAPVYPGVPEHPSPHPPRSRAPPSVFSRPPFRRPSPLRPLHSTPPRKSD